MQPETLNLEPSSAFNSQLGTRNFQQLIVNLTRNPGLDMARREAKAKKRRDPQPLYDLSVLVSWWLNSHEKRI